MRHYEIVFIIHPDRSEQVSVMIEKYKNIILSQDGIVHRVEDWGRKQMAYIIRKISKAHYICINIQCNFLVLQELEHAFKFNDSILRYLIVKLNKAEINPSIMMQQISHEDEKKVQQITPGIL